MYCAPSMHLISTDLAGYLLYGIDPLWVWDGAFDSASTNVAVGHYDVGDVTVMMEGGWQYTHGGIDYALDPATAPNRHPGVLAGGPVLSGLQVLTLRRHGFISLGTTKTRPGCAPNGTIAQWHNRDKKGPGVKELLRCWGGETSRDELKGSDGGVGGGGGCRAL